MFEITSPAARSARLHIGEHGSGPDATNSPFRVNAVSTTAPPMRAPSQEMMQENAPSLGFVRGEWSTGMRVSIAVLAFLAPLALTACAKGEKGDRGQTGRTGPASLMPVAKLSVEPSWAS